MKSTVVGSFPVEVKGPSSAKDKLLNTFGAYDPFKQSIKDSVTAQLDAGVDIISDGQVRGDMVSIFTEYIPGMKIEDGNTVIVSKIKRPTQEISIKDLQYAKKVMKEYYGGEIPEGKGIKGIITGPNTIVHSCRIQYFYRNKEDAIIDLARSLKFEVDAIAKKSNRSTFRLTSRFYPQVWLTWTLQRRPSTFSGTGLKFLWECMSAAFFQMHSETFPNSMLTFWISNLQETMSILAFWRIMQI